VKASEIYIFAYDLSVRNPDTLDVAQTPPDLLTQPNDQGAWQFFSMKAGHRYRVFAVADVYRNHLYDVGVDAVGVPPQDAVLDSAVKLNFFIRMSPVVDTIKPELQDAEAVDSFHVRAHFSEAIDSNDVRVSNFTLSGLPIVAAFRESPDKKPGQITLVTASPLTANGNYTLEARRDSVRDLTHNPVSDSAYKVSFSAPLTLHSGQPPKFISIGIRDSALDVSTMPAIPFVFSDAINRDSITHAITVTDTGGRIVPMRLDWSDDARFYLKSTDSLMSNVLYTIRMKTGGIRSAASGIPHDAKDTVFRWRFRTSSARDFGKMSGDITIADSFFTQNPAGALVVQVFQGASNVLRQIVLPHGEHQYSFDQVPVGTFRVRAYFSRSGTLTYDAGSVKPWRFGVPTGDYPKEITTRPRWEMSKIDFEIR